MAALLHHASLGLAVGALTGAALRVAGGAGLTGLERLVAAAPLGAGAAVAESLGLGLVGLGTETVALLAAALLTWAAARRLVGPPSGSLADDLSGWWRRLPSWARVLAAAAAGASAAWVAWMLRYPEIGLDGSAYHLPEALAWVRDGHPGSLHPTVPALPVENYPLTNEVLLSWLLGLSRGFAVITVYEAGMACLLGAAVVAGLRAVGVPPVPRALGALALLTVPLVVKELNGPYTDLPSLAWTACAAAMCAAAPRRPAALAVAIVAMGLAVGTKTTALLPSVLMLGALLGFGGRPRVSPRLLAGAGALALIVGAPWYVRNLLAHGSPFWPLQAVSWGDPQPPLLKLFNDRFIEAPVGAVRQAPVVYRQDLAGALVLIAGALLAPLLARRRAVVAAAAGTALLGLVWMASPFTGRAENPLLAEVVVSTTRYLLPTVAAALLTLALAARTGGWVGRAAVALLAAALTFNLVEVGRLGFPYRPGPGTLVAGALAGLAALGVVTALARTRAAARPAPSTAALAALAVVLGMAMLPASSGFARRHADVNYRNQRALIRWFTALPGYPSGRRPVFLLPLQIGVLAGDRLRHPLGLVPSESCSHLRRRARAAWVVTYVAPPTNISVFDAVNRRAQEVDRCLTGRFGPLAERGGYRVYGPPS